jgi:capsular exopolysaccharide synthesis family protein
MLIKKPEDKDFRYSEALRTLRTNILFSGSNVHKILITSTAPNEGKSTISFDLARVFAESGKKTLFIDCDIRNSEFVTVHGAKDLTRRETVGMSQILTGQIAMEDAFYQTEDIPNLHLVMAGPYSPNTTELFEDEMCEKFFQAIDEEHYDMVILDTAPIGTVIDAAILSRFVDGTVLVCESEVTSRKLLKKSKDQLDRTGIRFLGVIINKVNMSKSGYYGNYYKKYSKKYDEYGKYGYGYDKSRKKKS